MAITKPKGQQSLVLDNPKQQSIDLGLVPLLEKFSQGIMERIGNKAGADVHITDGPAQSKPVHQRHHRIGQQCQRYDKRDNETE